MNPDPFYEYADSSQYLGLTLDPKVLAELCQYDHDQVGELFEQDFKLIKHPVKAGQFKTMVLQICDNERRSWGFKRYTAPTEWEDGEEDRSECISVLTESS